MPPRVLDSRDPQQLVLPLDVPHHYFTLALMPVPVQQLLEHLIQPHRHTAPC